MKISPISHNFKLLSVHFFKWNIDTCVLLYSYEIVH